MREGPRAYYCTFAYVCTQMNEVGKGGRGFGGALSPFRMLSNLLWPAREHGERRDEGFGERGSSNFAWGLGATELWSEGRIKYPGGDWQHAIKGFLSTLRLGVPYL